MLCNIIDNRKRKYRWRNLNAIVEATEHDNSCADSDQIPEAEQGIAPTYENRSGISLNEAVQWASEFNGSITLYLYDAGSGIGEDHFEEMQMRFEN